MPEAKQQGKKNRKYGRTKDSAAQKRYNAENHQALNKKRHIEKAKKLDAKHAAKHAVHGAARARRRGHQVEG